MAPRERFAGTDKGFCASYHSDVLEAAENDGGAGSQQTGFAGPAPRLGRIIEKRFEVERGRNGASGTSDMHGKAARVAESVAGGTRMNSSRSAEIALRK